MTRPCEECGGCGMVDVNSGGDGRGEADRCPDCKGTGRVTDARPLSFQDDATVAGSGDQTACASSGAHRPEGRTPLDPPGGTEPTTGTRVECPECERERLDTGYICPNSGDGRCPGLPTHTPGVLDEIKETVFGYACESLTAEEAMREIMGSLREGTGSE